jgi:phosphopantothenoylcysteine decarboxylase/phosphopantothenate--cysteine ligase
MNQAMWENTLTQRNLQALHARAVHVLGPGEGSQACGEVGPGRMLEPIEIVTRVSKLFATGSLTGRHVLITAGPTHEAIDPVRYISNASSGKMGYALAAAAVEAGAKVTLVSGPVNLPRPARVQCVDVVSAADMQAAVMEKIAACDIFLSVAAVADYRCKTVATQKIKKDADELQLTLVRNPDILAGVAALEKRPFVVGFAAETDDVILHARAKQQAKKLDMIVANAATAIGGDENAVTVLWGKADEMALPRMSKQQLARELIQLISIHSANTRH